MIGMTPVPPEGAAKRGTFWLAAARRGLWWEAELQGLPESWIQAIEPGATFTLLRVAMNTELPDEPQVLGPYHRSMGYQRMTRFWALTRAGVIRKARRYTGHRDLRVVDGYANPPT